MIVKIFLPLYFILILLTHSPSADADESRRIGTTFSRQQCIYLGLDWKETYDAVLELDWDIIRLGAYWNEIEGKEGRFDFTTLDWEIEKAKEKNIPVILTIGMKAPRWPEYFIPAWVFGKTKLYYSDDISKNEILKEYTLRFIKTVFERYRDEEIITHIQVENEALNKFGSKNWQLSKDFLTEEVNLIKSLDPLNRPVILTAATYPNKFLRFFANIFTKGNWIKNNLELCDVLGINVYPVIGHKTFGVKHYVKTVPAGRIKSIRDILKIVKKENKEVWVMELQAEPWEPGKLVDKGKPDPPSVSPDAVKKYFEELINEGYGTILLWGSEYWYFQKKENHNLRWWNMAQELIEARKDPVPANVN